jgi:hypothetical protein
MKNIKYYFLAFVLIAACKCNNDKHTPTKADSVIVIPDTLLVYEVNTEAKTMKRFTEVPDSAFTAQRVINGLNDKYANVQLQLLKQSNDTLYVSVPNNEFLGERMGSTGASAWFQDAVINLTSVPTVNYVNIQMEKRSHALPGIFSKENVKDFKEVKDSIPVS